MRKAFHEQNVRTAYCMLFLPSIFLCHILPWELFVILLTLFSHLGIISECWAVMRRHTTSTGAEWLARPSFTCRQRYALTPCSPKLPQGHIRMGSMQSVGLGP